MCKTLGASYVRDVCCNLIGRPGHGPTYFPLDSDTRAYGRPVDRASFLRASSIDLAFRAALEHTLVGPPVGVGQVGLGCGRECRSWREAKLRW